MRLWPAYVITPQSPRGSPIPIPGSLAGPLGDSLPALGIGGAKGSATKNSLRLSDTSGAPGLSVPAAQAALPSFFPQPNAPVARNQSCLSDGGVHPM